VRTREIREMTDVELAEALAKAKEESFNLRFRAATNQLDNTALMKAVKKDIARMLTVRRERERAAGDSPETVEEGA